MKAFLYFVVLTAVLLHGRRAYAVTKGALTGVVTDTTGAAVTSASLNIVDTVHHTSFQTRSDRQGIYTFRELPAGHYELTASAAGFTTSQPQDILLNTAANLRIDVTLSVGTQTDTVVVHSAQASQVERESDQLGGVISPSEMTSLPLNGRSYTDLLGLEPGVAPASTLLPGSVIMAGVTGSIDPSGDASPGTLSIDGQRESANGFLVNGIDVQEHMNGGTSIVPDLDSIEQLQVLTSNPDPEYGDYNGGIVSVTTMSGGNAIHGSAFEFFRNTILDARGYFDPERAEFVQNQFGGTAGGAIRKDRLFLFSDYQGTRTAQGISTGTISVPTLAQRSGSFDDLSGLVSGSYLASLLTRELGYAVASGEPYDKVFPNGIIPHSAWSAPAQHLLSYIPAPNVGLSSFSTSKAAQTVRDDKGSVRVDASTRFGQISVYNFIDDYSLDNPYPTSVAGATIPGFDASYLGRAQLFSVGQTAVLSAKAVHELRVGFLRNSNIVGQPKGGLGVSLAAQGFTASSGAGPGIDVQAPQFEGVENITFPTFAMGVPITNMTQVNNTWFVSEGLSLALGRHTLKFGGQFHADQINTHPNATFNGTFNINGTETGNPYADLLLGVASNFTQSSGQPFYLRNKYLGLYAQDSWRVSNKLTLNAGLRWDQILPWWEKYNQIQTYIPGARSVLFPGAPVGLVVAGDPGVPRTIAPANNLSLGPRLGVAYTPGELPGWLGRIVGRSEESSVRASYGMFYTAFQGLSAGIMYAVPPFGYNYLSPGPPLLATPFITAATGTDNGQRFPISFPPHSVSQSNPDTAVDWSNLVPVSADPFFSVHNRPAYIGSYMLSVQRQLTSRALITVSYAGNQGHHLLTLVSANPGNPALCLQLAPACGPFGEDNVYVTQSGKTIQGTRVGQGPLYGENTADESVANSNYNALQATLRYEHGGSQILLNYTFAKSIDQGSNLGEQLDPLDPRQSRTLSAWDMRHDVDISYTLALPVLRASRLIHTFTAGLALAGNSRFATGFPVTLSDSSDNSLLGTLGNGANNFLLDTPRQLQGPLRLNRNGRNDRPAFNTALFPAEVLGQLGTARRRVFSGPGIDNFDVTLRKTVALSEGRSLQLHVEAFNAFNHAQFYGAGSVNGQRQDPNFGHIQSAAPGRLVQLAAKFAF